MPVPILAYHKISNKHEWGITSVRIRQFESQVRYLSQQNYQTISLERYITGDYKSSRQQPRIIITFDDADESVYHHAFPILKAHGFTATLFVISDFVGKNNSWDANLGGVSSQHLNWKQIIDLSEAGWKIGSHTARHRDLTNLSDEQIVQELLHSKDTIAQKINLPVRFLSYPFNRFDARVISLTQNVGYSAGCALYATQKLQHTFGNYCIPRSGVYSIDTMEMFRLKLINSPVERLKQRMISLASRGTIWYKRWKN